MFVALFALLCFLLLLILPNQQTKWIKMAAMWGGFLGLGLSSWQCMEFIEGAKPSVFRVKWFEIASTSVELIVRLDAMSVFFQLVVAVVVCAVLMYSLAYFEGKEEKVKFYYAFLYLFVFAMQALLIQDSWIAFFICWELMGLASFLLIDFDKTILSNRASIKAFLLNRIGDIGLLVAIVLLWQQSNTITGMHEAFRASASTDQFLIGIGIALAVWIKTGQFPFSTWLTDAMQAPTPVSALLHAATMVAAGVYLFIRCESVFSELPLLSFVLIGAGLLSSFLAAYAAYFTSVFKRQLAASTISQLGFMLVAVLLGTWQAALLHVWVHAFFKAVLFLNAGYLIHHTHQTTLQKIGEELLIKKTPIVWFHALALAALLGLPLSSGFLSKEWILASSFQHNTFIGSSLMVISFFTAMYAGRQVQFLFFAGTPSAKTVFSKTKLWLFPMAMLSLGSLWIVFSWNPFSIENSWFANYFSVSPTHSVSHGLAFIAVASMGAGFALGFSRHLFAYLSYTKANFENYFQWQDNFFVYLLWQPTTNLALFAAQKNPSFGTIAFATHFAKIGKTLAIFDRKADEVIDSFSKIVVVWAVLSAWLDKYVLDGVLSVVIFSVNIAGKLLRNLQNGKVQFYVSVVFLLLIIALMILLS